MAIEYLGVKEISGPLVVLENVKGASYEEIVEIDVGGKEKRMGQIISIDGDKAVVQVFEGTEGISKINTKTHLTGEPLKLPLSKEILGRVFSGVGKPIDGLGNIYPDIKADVNGKPINPVSREYPRNYIETGISSIDALTTLIRGQKLPIFSGNGLPHDALAVQIARQAKIADDKGSDFAIVFAAIGVKNDVANYFKKAFSDSGVLEKVVMFLNLSNDPVTERIITPRAAAHRGGIPGIHA